MKGKVTAEFQEKEIIKLIKYSDSNAFRELCGFYYEQLYGFIWRRTGNPEVVKDILQDLFLNVWKLRERLNEDKSLKSYLFTSAANLIKNYYKTKSRYNSRIGDTSVEQLSINKEAYNNWDNYINEVLLGIPENLKKVFILNKFEGFKYAEIAEMLDISEKTVESRMSKVLKILRKKFTNNSLIFLILSILMIVFLYNSIV